jgi:hypothetical protein
MLTNRSNTGVEVSWQQLKGKISEDVFAAPKTVGDPMHLDTRAQLDERVIKYLEKESVGRPWGNQLTLAAAIMAAHHLDAGSLILHIRTLNTYFKETFDILKLRKMTDWNPEPHIRIYLEQSKKNDEDNGKGYRFWKSYSSASINMARWLRSLPEDIRESYKQFMLPPLNFHIVEDLIDTRGIDEERRRNRKEETDAVLPHFIDIRAEAHFRYNRMVRLRQAFKDACYRVVSRSQSLPFEFSYEEGEGLEVGTPAQERLHFRLWDRRSFTLAHSDKYCSGTVERAKYKMGYYADDEQRLYLEFLGAERLVDDGPPEGLWFEDLLRTRILSTNTKTEDPDIRRERHEWLKEWGYVSEDEATQRNPFVSHTPGLLRWSIRDVRFVQNAEKITDGVFIPVEPLYAASIFGLLAADIITTTGAMLNELLQISLDEICLVVLTLPAPPKAKDHTPRQRVVLRLIPKGERTDTRHDYFISKETARLIERVAHMLQDHYGIDMERDQKLPLVPYNRHNHRHHRFDDARYLFQYSYMHLEQMTVTACMRFLLHGMIFHRRDGQLVVIKAHLLRHLFATHAHHVEGVPLDIVGAWLKQKSLEVTEYYTQVTDSMVAEAADSFLVRIAQHIDVRTSVLRLPEELQRQSDEAQARLGTLANVAGGECTNHNMCPPQYSCIDCAFKVPDPGKRSQVEDKLQWATDRLNKATEEGLLMDVEQFKDIVRKCQAELKEMDLIVAYRKDENNGALIQITRKS